MIDPGSDVANAQESDGEHSDENSIPVSGPGAAKNAVPSFEQIAGRCTGGPSLLVSVSTYTSLAFVIAFLIWVAGLSTEATERFPKGQTTVGSPGITADSGPGPPLDAKESNGRQVLPAPGAEYPLGQRSPFDIYVEAVAHRTNIEAVTHRMMVDRFEQAMPKVAPQDLPLEKRIWKLSETLLAIKDPLSAADAEKKFRLVDELEPMIIKIMGSHDIKYLTYNREEEVFRDLVSLAGLATRVRGPAATGGTTAFDSQKFVKDLLRPGTRKGLRSAAEVARRMLGDITSSRTAENAAENRTVHGCEALSAAVCAMSRFPKEELTRLKKKMEMLKVTLPMWVEPEVEKWLEDHLTETRAHRQTLSESVARSIVRGELDELKKFGFHAPDYLDVSSFWGTNENQK